jgi:hypothetical protein
MRPFLVRFEAEHRVYVSTTTSNATHAKVTKDDLEPHHIGEIYKILKFDWKDCIAYLPNGKTRIFYQDEYLPRREAYGE